MEKKIKDNIKLRNKIIEYIYIYFLLNIMLLLSSLSVQKKQCRKLSIYNSEVYLTIYGSGVQNLLSNDFYANPSDVIVNGISKKDVCNKICELEGDVNKITLVFEDEINSCENMFKHSSNIKEIDLSNFDTSKATSMKSMFDNCINLEKITFGNINTSLVNNMDRFCSDCISLKSIDLSKFDTSEVTTMREMFARCKKIKIVDASSFKTPKVVDMFDIFAYSDELITVNISNFDISNVQIFQGMFYCCHKLRFLDLSNFNISKAKNTNIPIKGKKLL